MTIITLLWIALPFLLGFSSYLLARCDRPLALGMGILSLAYSGTCFWAKTPLQLSLLDTAGVTLQVDSLSGFFILTNALVTLAVVLYCWRSDRIAFFFTQILILHGSLNAIFICADFMSVYVALEVIGIAAFLLITYPRSDRSLWVGLRYLFISNTAMLFYLIGAVLIYQANQSFAFSGLQNAPSDAIALILLGLLTKGGIFLSGLWLPLTHSESESPVSAMLSGIVVKAGIFPLLRLALVVEGLDPWIRFFGMATALLGVAYALFEQDAKRLLAFSTVSQLGFVLAAPAVGGFYALTHGLAKATLFLGAGHLPSRRFQELQQQAIPVTLWSILALASFSICGLPFLAGFSAKAMTLKSLLPWQVWGMNLAALGTVIALSKFIFSPWKREGSISRDLTMSTALLLGVLILASGFYLETYTWQNLGKILATVAIAVGGYWLIVRTLTITLPRSLERLEHLLGMMGLALLLMMGRVMA